MRNRLLILSCLIFFTACRHRENEALRELDGTTNVQPAPVLSVVPEVEPFKEFAVFWDYYARRIKLNEDFVGYDSNRKQISKLEFLKALSMGIYQPIIINPTDSIRYQLKPNPQGVEAAIRDYMRMYAEKELVFYNMEKKSIPEFSFKTLDGDSYTSENTKGKIVLFKCWFISCLPCVQEMPELNAMVESYKDRKDIIFLSLAIDDAMPLKNFHEKTRFDYQTVAEQKSYMTNKLMVSAYPTHFLMDKEGRVVKVAHSGTEIRTFLKRLLDPTQ